MILYDTLILTLIFPINKKYINLEDLVKNGNLDMCFIENTSKNDEFHAVLKDFYKNKKISFLLSLHGNESFNIRAEIRLMTDVWENIINKDEGFVKTVKSMIGNIFEFKSY